MYRYYYIYLRVNISFISLRVCYVLFWFVVHRPVTPDLLKSRSRVRGLYAAQIMQQADDPKVIQPAANIFFRSKFLFYLLPSALNNRYVQFACENGLVLGVRENVSFQDGSLATEPRVATKV